MSNRNKGNSFENTTARYIAGWLTPKLFAYYQNCEMADVPVRRQSTALVPVTGHWRGSGDLLVAWNLKLPFTVECKNHGVKKKGKSEKWTLDSMVSGASRLLGDWWAQCVEQAKSARGVPLLVFTRNNAPLYAALPYTVERHSVLLRKRVFVAVVPISHTERVLLCLLPDLVSVPIAALA